MEVTDSARLQSYISLVMHSLTMSLYFALSFLFIVLCIFLIIRGHGVHARVFIYLNIGSVTVNRIPPGADLGGGSGGCNPPKRF